MSMRNHIAAIVERKRINQDISFMDIFIDYVEEFEDEFDIDQFISLLKLREFAGLKEFIKKDLVKFHFSDEELSVFSELF